MPTPAAAAADDAQGQVSAETEAKSAATSVKSEIETGTGTGTATAIVNVKKKQQLQALTLPPPLPLSPLPLLWTPGWESLFTGAGAGTSSGSLFGLGHSPGPITLARSCFGSAGDVAAATTPGSDVEFKSFSQLLATAIASPSASASANTPASASLSRGGAGFFPLSPGFSPGLLLDSPQASLGVSHQEALAQVQAQAQLRGRSCFESALPVSSSCQVEEYHAGAGGDQGNGKGEGTTHAAATVADENNEVVLASQPSTEITQKSLSTVTLAPADKPADDGYNWRKYGQKAVKGSEYPRSYYRCTYVSCPVKKKVERSLDGIVTEIVYKGEHNHSRPQHGKPLAASAQNTMFSEQDSPHEKDHSETREHANAIALDASMELDMSQGCSVDDEEDDEAARPDNDDDDNDAAVPKRRKKEKNIQDIVAAPRTIKEPRIIVQTTSDVDILDDGYRWRKYGQKVVKGNPNPRSYYKCTNAGCTVRKHVERASNDAKAVITTYEGKHNHDVPTCKNSNDSASLNSQFHHGTHAVTRITASKASVSLLDQQMAPSLIH